MEELGEMGSVEQREDELKRKVDEIPYLDNNALVVSRSTGVFFAGAFGPTLQPNSSDICIFICLETW